MRRMFPALVLGLLLAPAAALAATPPKAGTYEVVTLSPAGGTVFFLVKITPKGDGVEGEFVAGHPALRNLGLKSITLDGDMLHIALKGGPGGDSSFEGRVTKAGADMVIGSFESGGRVTPGRISFTEKAQLAQADTIVRTDPVEPMRKVQSLNTSVAQLRQRAAQAKAADEKAKLTKDVADADKAAQAELPKLYREVLEKHPDHLAVTTAVPFLIRQAGKDKVDAAQVRAWAAAMLKVAQTYGPRYEGEVTTQVAELLAPQDLYAALAMEYAQRSEARLNDKSPFEQKIRVLNLLATAQKKAGQPAESAKTTARVAKLELDSAIAAEKALTAQSTLEIQSNVLSKLAAAQKKSGMTTEAAATEARLVKIDADLDREYLSTMPPFKPTAFEGRKAKSDRIAVMELFTGAQCPPCVAADLAFDGLEKTYKHNDVLLIQYHMHIPGPDPMTNPSTEARWDYYREIFPGQIGGVPSSLFNGKPEAGGGGGTPQAEAKYKQYRGIIERLLEEQPGAAVSLNANRVGDVVTVKADVSKLENPGEGKKVRLLLAEETIRFVGSNKIRFHHMVVRAMPGGPAGMALTQKDSQHSASVNLMDLRGDLTKYLDTYAAEKRPFPQPERPLDFKNLKAIALVQDDKTGEILQAAIVDVGGDRASK